MSEPADRRLGFARDLRLWRHGTLSPRELRDELIDEVQTMLRQAVRPGLPQPAGRSGSIAYHLARLELAATFGRDGECAELPAPWDRIALLSPGPCRAFLHHLGLSAMATLLRREPGATPAESHPLLVSLGEERAALVRARCALPGGAEFREESERSAVLELALRLARERHGESLAVALGRRLLATAWHALGESDRESVRRRIDPALSEMFARMEPLRLQAEWVLSLVEESLEAERPARSTLEEPRPERLLTHDRPDDKRDEYPDGQQDGQQDAAS